MYVNWAESHMTGRSRCYVHDYKNYFTYPKQTALNWSESLHQSLVAVLCANCASRPHGPDQRSVHLCRSSLGIKYAIVTNNRCSRRAYRTGGKEFFEHVPWLEAGISTWLWHCCVF